MSFLSNIPEFWLGFICGGIAVPVVIIIIEVIVKLLIHGKVKWK